jgi:hypothetical protein
LCNIFARNAGNGLPVIKLGTSSYRHRTYGRIDIPDFPVVDWNKASTDTGGEDDMVQVVSPADEMNDEIPF